MARSKPHDALFRWLLGRVDEARALLEAVLPPRLWALLDADGLRIELPRLDEPDLDHREPDAIAVLPSARGEVHVAILLEHQSENEPDIVARVNASAASVWDAARRSGRAPAAVVGLVVHHGPRPWTAPRTIRAWLALPAELDAALGPYLPNHPYLLLDLSTQSARELAAFPSDSPLLRAALFVLQRARESDAIDEELAAITGDLRRVGEQRDGATALLAIFRYLMEVAPSRSAEIARRVQDVVSPEVEEQIMGSIFEEKVREAQSRGEALGEARGEARGRAAILLDLLEQKFGPLPPALHDRVARADVDEVSVLARRVLFATSLDEVFATRS